jgi:hypothetical protein
MSFKTHFSLWETILNVQLFFEIWYFSKLFRNYNFDESGRKDLLGPSKQMEINLGCFEKSSNDDTCITGLFVSYFMWMPLHFTVCNLEDLVHSYVFADGSSL